MAKLLVVQWEWGPGTKHAGARFSAVHNVDADGRIADWPGIGLIPVAAAEVTVVDGEGLHLLKPIARRAKIQRVEDGHE